LPLANAAGNTYYVGTISDDNGLNTAHCGSSSNTDCSLRDAIGAAISGSDTIQFVTGLNGVILLTQGQLLLTVRVTISGPGTNVIAVDGNATSRVFQVNGGVTAAFSGITIQNGNATVGGGIYNFGTLMLTNCVLTGNNAAIVGGGGSG